MKQALKRYHPFYLAYWAKLSWNQTWAMALVIKNLPTNAGAIRNTGSIPESGRSPAEGSGNPLQCSCLENPMDRGACWATVHGVTESNMTEETWHTSGSQKLNFKWDVVMILTIDQANDIPNHIMSKKKNPKN